MISKMLPQTLDPENMFLHSYLNPSSISIEYENKMASGGLATIYNAHFNGNGVVVKIVDVEEPYGKIETVKENIYKEANAILKLPQQYAAKLYGVFVDEQGIPMRIGFVMKRYTCNLYNFIVEHKENLSWEKKNDMIKRCFECLQWIHNVCSDGIECGMLHNRIKSENFLLTIEDGEIKELVIADFGFADMRAYQSYYESIHSVLGLASDKAKITMTYQAPELFAEDVVPYTKRSDLFSLGRVVGEDNNWMPTISPRPEQE